MAEHSDQVSQAVAVIMEQASCTMEEAFVLMHERATMSGSSMEDVMSGVADGSIRFGVTG